MKALNIRDYKNDPQTRQIMGLFKHMAYELGLQQGDLLKLLYTNSLKDLVEQYKLEKGYVMEIDLKELRNE